MEGNLLGGGNANLIKEFLNAEQNKTEELLCECLVFCTVFFVFVLFLKTNVHFNGDVAQYYFSTLCMHCACLSQKIEHEEILRNTFWILADPSAFIIYDHLVNSCLLVSSLYFLVISN